MSIDFTMVRGGEAGGGGSGNPGQLQPSRLASLGSVSRGRTRARSGNSPTMGNFQVRRRSKPHRGFAKKAPAHPLHREGYNKVTPSAPTGHLPLPGLPQRFCEAKDLREEETQAERSSRKERSGGPAGFAATRRQGRAGSPAIYSLRHGVGLTTPPSCLWQATVSAAQGKRRLGQEISQQWEISKLAGGQRAHLVAARRFGLRRASFAA